MSFFYSITMIHALFQIVSIYNGRRKVIRLAEEVKDLAKHGVMIKPELQGLNSDQIKVGTTSYA